MAAAVSVQSEKKRCMNMDGTKFNRRFLKMLLRMQCEKETLDYVIQEMRAVLGEKMPEEDAVRAYLKDPG